MSFLSWVEKKEKDKKKKYIYIYKEKRKPADAFFILALLYTCTVKCMIDVCITRTEWAPDGLHVVTWSECGLKASVWSLSDRSISVVRRPKDGCFASSPDGKWMAFAERRDCKDWVLVLGLAQKEYSGSLFFFFFFISMFLPPLEHEIVY